MDVIFNYATWSIEENGIWLKLCVQEHGQAKQFCSEMVAGKPYVAKLSRYRKKRSLDANAYAWVLMEQIAKATNTTKEGVYWQEIQDVGVLRQVEVSDYAVDTLMHGWHLHGLGWIAEKVDYSIHDGFTVVNLYYGSSTYNTKQMSRLIDNIVQDCKELNIETMTAQELSILKENWNAKTDKSN